MSDSALATLGIVVDPTGMESGVARGVSALQRMISSAMATETAMRNVHAGLDTFSTSGSGMESGANRASSALGAMAEKLRSLTSLTLLASNSLNIVRAGFDGLSGAWGWLTGFVDAGAQVERFETQFAGLMGSFDKAKTLLGQIRAYANSSPFEFPEAAQAARTLYSLTQGMEDVPKLLLTVGDAAAQGGKSLTETAETLGRLYSTIKLGTGYDDPLRTLGQNGVVSPQLVRTVTMMVQGGKDAHEIWQKVLEDLSRNAGASERLSRTYDGLKSTLHDAYDTVQAAFGRPISDALKAPIHDLGEWLGAKDGVAAKFGVALGDGVKQFYGAFRTGQFSAYLQQEYDVAINYLRTKWDAFGPWAGGQLQRYVFGPLSDFDYVGKIGEAFGRLDRVITDALTRGVKGALVAFNAFDQALTESFAASLKVAVLQVLAGIKQSFSSEFLFSGPSPDAHGLQALKDERDASVAAGRYEMQRDHRNDLPLDFGGGYASGFNTTRELTLEQSLAKAKDELATKSDALKSKLGDLDKAFNVASNSAGALASGYQKGFLGNDAPFGGYTAGYGGWGNVAAGGGSTAASLITGTRSYVFGTEMSGGPDRSAQRDHFYDFNGVDHPEYRNVGAYNNTDLLNPNLMGAAVSPQQASVLTGIADENKAIASLLGQMLQIGLNGKTAQVQVVDQAPNSNRGIELTPAAHRAVGDTRGDAPISFGLPGGQTTVDMQKIMAAATVSQVGAGNGIARIADDLEKATQAAAGFGIKIVDGNHDVLAYDANMKLLDLQVRQYNATQGKAGLSEQQANTIRLQARGSLVQSSASYKQLAVTLGEAAAKQKEYNDRAAEAKEKMGLNQYGTGNSLRQGATDWAKAQGTSDQQYYKLMGDSLDSLTNRSTDLFASMANGSRRAGQAFKEFAIGMMEDIAKLIIKLLILKAVQMLVGAFGGGGGMSFGTFHTGGMVGAGSGGSTNVHPLLFLGAPRFHSGGQLGLGPDEVPIIAQTGERVLNRRETLEYNRGERASRGGGANYSRGGDTSFNMPITINSNGDHGTTGGKDPLADPAFAKAFHKRMQGVAQEEIVKAQRYRGALNQG